MFFLLSVIKFIGKIIQIEYNYKSCGDLLVEKDIRLTRFNFLPRLGLERTI